MDNLEKLIGNVDFKKMLYNAKEEFEKLDKCKKAGHPNSKIYSSDPLRYRVWYECGDCNAFYERPMTSEQVKGANKLMNLRFTI